MIVLKDWNSYLKKLYESNDVMDNIQPPFIEDDVFFFKQYIFWIKCRVNGKN